MSACAGQGLSALSTTLVFLLEAATGRQAC